MTTESFYRPFELKCFRKVQKVPRKELFRRYTRPKIEKRVKRIKTLDSGDFTNDEQKQQDVLLPKSPLATQQKINEKMLQDINYNGSYMQQHVLLQSPKLPRE